MCVPKPFVPVNPQHFFNQTCTDRHYNNYESESMSLSHLTLYIYELLYVDIMELIMISRDCIDDSVLRVIDNTSKLELGDRIRESLYSTYGYTPHALKKREWINVHKKESMINRLPTSYFAIALDKDFIKKL
jgi:hypothetical protein